MNSKFFVNFTLFFYVIIPTFSLYVSPFAVNWVNNNNTNDTQQAIIAGPYNNTLSIWLCNDQSCNQSTRSIIQVLFIFCNFNFFDKQEWPLL